MSGGCFLNKGMQGRDGDPLSYKTATAVTCVAMLPSIGTSGFVQVNCSVSLPCTLILHTLTLYPYTVTSQA